jgi:hypothetical protein
VHSYGHERGAVNMNPGMRSETTAMGRGLEANRDMMVAEKEMKVNVAG